MPQDPPIGFSIHGTGQRAEHKARYPADPPTVEEIIAVMRQTGDNRHGWRLVNASPLREAGVLRLQHWERLTRRMFGYPNYRMPESAPRRSPRTFWKASRDNIVAVAAVATVLLTIIGLGVTYLAFHDATSHESREEAAQHADAERAQAEQVSASVAQEFSDTHNDEVTRVAMYNRSSLPIYDAVVTLVLVQGAGYRFGTEVNKQNLQGQFQRYFSSISPGKYETQVSAGWAGMMARPGIEIAFTDHNGRSWVRYANGRLIALTKTTPASYYKLDEPVGWETPQPFR